MKRFFNAAGSFFSALWAGRASRVLLLLAGALLISAAVVAVCLLDEGVTAANNAQMLSKTYDNAVMAGTALTDESAEMPEIPTETTKADPEPVTIDGYQVMGKLEIPKIDAELPVIAYTDDEALKISVCYYQGPMPGEPGNLVITGHNYASGAHFGRLDELQKGDDVTLSMPDGSRYDFKVTGTQKIMPDNPEALDNDEGGHIMTLLTCTNHGNERLLVRCGLV